MWEPDSIKYLEVRVSGDGFPVRIRNDVKRGMFSGFDEMNEKRLRVRYGLVRKFLERPEKSIFMTEIEEIRDQRLNFKFDNYAYFFTYRYYRLIL